MRCACPSGFDAWLLCSCRSSSRSCSRRRKGLSAGTPGFEDAWSCMSLPDSTCCKHLCSTPFGDIWHELPASAAHQMHADEQRKEKKVLMRMTS